MTAYTIEYVNSLDNEILCLCFDKFDDVAIKHVIHFLINEPKTRLKEDPEYGVFPVSIRIGESLVFNERAFWDLYVQSTIFDVTDIEEYFKTAKKHLLCDENQIHCDDNFGVIGIGAVFSFLKYSLPEFEIGKYKERESIRRVIQVFVEALLFEDLDHEMLHNDYIVKVLSFLNTGYESERNLFVKLLLIRLTRGQINMYSGFMSEAFEYFLKIRGGLRYFVHYFMEHMSGGFEEVISLCGYVYALADQPTKDVLEYCHIRWPEVITRNAISSYKPNFREVSLQQKFNEIWNPKAMVNTGFHTGENYEWIKIEYSEDRIKSSRVSKIEGLF